MESASSVIIISQEEFLLFHNIDRELYKILVINLSREPKESMQVLALWLWLERVGFRGMVKKILSLPNFVINEVANEGVICLNYINNGMISSSFEGNDMHLLRSLVDKEISLQILYENRVRAAQGVAKILHDVCARAFSDIVQKVEMTKSTKGMVVMPSSQNHSCFGSIRPTNNGVDEVDGAESNTTPQNEVLDDY